MEEKVRRLFKKWVKLQKELTTVTEEIMETKVKEEKDRFLKNAIIAHTLPLITNTLGNGLYDLGLVGFVEEYLKKGGR